MEVTAATDGEELFGEPTPMTGKTGPVHPALNTRIAAVRRSAASNDR